MQSVDDIGTDILFPKNYAYFSSYIDALVEQAKDYVNRSIDRFALDAHSLVAEVASNDGYLLQFVRDRKIPCYGIEPTASTAEVARHKGIDVIEDFFGIRLAQQLARQGRRVDLVAANNVLAQAPDINDFVGGFAQLLKPNGVATFEFPHLLNLIRQNLFDTIYHEHFSYFSLHTVNTIFEKNGLKIFDVENVSSHGGSYRVYAQAKGTGDRPRRDSVDEILNKEESLGINTKAFYENLQARAEAVRNEFMSFLIAAKTQNKKVGAYGAAAKGNTLFNFAGVRSDLVPWVVDRSKFKAGRFLPGSRIPIKSEDVIKIEKPDFILILPWNLKKDICEKLAYVRDWGCKFVVAIPKLEVF